MSIRHFMIGLLVDKLLTAAMLRRLIGLSGVTVFPAFTVHVERGEQESTAARALSQRDAARRPGRVILPENFGAAVPRAPRNRSLIVLALLVLARPGNLIVEPPGSPSVPRDH
jgi:hypothetical protein